MPTFHHSGDHPADTLRRMRVVLSFVTDLCCGPPRTHGITTEGLDGLSEICQAFETTLDDILPILDEVPLHSRRARSCP